MKIETNLSQLHQALQTASVAVLDFETTSVDPRTMRIVGAGFFLPVLLQQPQENSAVAAAGRAFYINLAHVERDPRFPPVSQDDLVAVLRPFLQNPLRQIIAHNAVFELRGLFRMGIDDIRCRVSDSLIHIHRYDENLRDSLGTWHYHLPQLNYGLKNLMAALEGVRPPRLAEVTGNRNPMFAAIEPIARYCMLDCQNSWTLYCRAAEHFAMDPTLAGLVQSIDDPNNLVLACMMWEGIGVDTQEARHQ